MTDVFYRHYFQRFHYMFPNCYGGDGKEMDIMGVRPSRYVDEIEIKVSKSDYKADFKKEVTHYISEQNRLEKKLKHDQLAKGELTPNRFWFFVPEDLAPEIAVPTHAGLVVMTKTGIREVKEAPLLHKRKLEVGDIHRLTKNMMYRYWQFRTAINDEKRSQERYRATQRDAQ
jgi:hypothetical protein